MSDAATLEFSFDGYHETIPENKEAAMKAAWLRVKDDKSLRDVADDVGYHHSTIYNWAQTRWWEDLKDEVWSEIISGSIARKALRTLEESLGEDGDTKTARWTLERLRKALAPPKQRLAHTIREDEEGGGESPWYTILANLSRDEQEALDCIVSAYVKLVKDRNDEDVERDEDFSDFEVIIEAARDADRTAHNLQDLT